ncbi:MAG: hypothetical protein FJW23_03810 [Acidimicrobiia bacterium]|nr:hypothetical protein [Acidimicrobiia bacterium]
MPTDNAPHRGGRGYRGRRHDRRGDERRGPNPSQGQRGPRNPARTDQVDVEQIMRDIRTRVAQQHGIDLSDQQIVELAARRLEAVLDVRTANPVLLDQLRKAAGARPVVVPSAGREPAFQFEDSTLYASHRGFLRAIRKLLNPVLKLFFNPNPLIAALNAQARINTATGARIAAHEQRQAEWNALHYEILHRMVTETARLSVEVQQLASRVESLGARVDFADRRVRAVEAASLEAAQAPSRQPPPRVTDERPPAPAPAPTSASSPDGDGATGEGGRRRRRRRRGRRPDRGGEGPAAAGRAVQPAETDPSGDDADDFGEEQVADGAAPAESERPVAESAPVQTGFAPPQTAAPEASAPAAPLEPAEPLSAESPAPRAVAADGDVRAVEPSVEPPPVAPRWQQILPQEPAAPPAPPREPAGEAPGTRPPDDPDDGPDRNLL